VIVTTGAIKGAEVGLSNSFVSTQHVSKSRFFYHPDGGYRDSLPPIRDCAKNCDNRGPKRLKLSAIDATEKTIFECLYLVPGLGTFGPSFNYSYSPTTPTVQLTTISRFLCNIFPRMAPKLFCHHDSPRI